MCQPRAAGLVRQEVGTGLKLAAADSSPGTCGEVEHSEAEPDCQQGSVATCQPSVLRTPSLPVPSFPVLTDMSPHGGAISGQASLGSSFRNSCLEESFIPLSGTT